MVTGSAGSCFPPLLPVTVTCLPRVAGNIEHFLVPSVPDALLALSPRSGGSSRQPAGRVTNIPGEVRKRRLTVPGLARGNTPCEKLSGCRLVIFLFDFSTIDHPLPPEVLSFIYDNTCLFFLLAAGHFSMSPW